MIYDAQAIQEYDVFREARRGAGEYSYTYWKVGSSDESLGPTQRRMRWLAVLLLSGCGSTHVEVSMGPELNPPWNRSSNNWRGDGPIVDAAIRTEGERTFCEYRHTSNLFSHGADETWLDRVTCGIKLQIRE